MNKLDDKLLDRIEGILHVKINGWKRDYILGNIDNIHLAGRGNGITMIRALRILFEKDAPIHISRDLLGRQYLIEDRYNMRIYSHVLDSVICLHAVLGRENIRTREIIGG